MTQDLSRLLKPDHSRITDIEDRLTVLENDFGVVVNHLGQLTQAVQQQANSMKMIGVVVTGHHKELLDEINKVESKIKRVSMALTAIRGGVDVLGEQPVPEDERVDVTAGQVGDREGGSEERAPTSTNESTDENSRQDGGDHR